MRARSMPRRAAGVKSGRACVRGRKNNMRHSGARVGANPECQPFAKRLDSGFGAAHRPGMTKWWRHLRHPAAAQRRWTGGPGCGHSWRAYATECQRVSWITPSAEARHAAGLVRHRGCARLYRAAVRHRELWRPADRRGGAAAAVDLSALARDLLHVVDLLRLGRPCDPQRLRLPRHLHRPDPGDRARLPADHPHHPALQGAEHRLDRRLHRRALRQAPGRRGGGRAHRDRRDDPLHRVAAQGDLVLARRHRGAARDRRRAGAADARRSAAVRRALARRLCRAVRHAPYRCDRAPARPHAGGGG